ncbi:unnamed protein product [Caenorhabditis auriculariae]|uniref:Uncharacterized protein n=1 Tax=Caenorhabditis auriculariae TaxID=2777116 RepID=A0A8S1HA24_9PELO|nr:unnamed protein product [Caenorhabditis auriculariae]
MNPNKPSKWRRVKPLARTSATESCESSPLSRSPADSAPPSPLIPSSSPNASQCGSTSCTRSNSTRSNRPPNLLREIIHARNLSSLFVICAAHFSAVASLHKKLFLHLITILNGQVNVT